MSNSTTKKFSPVTLPPQTSKSSFWQLPTNDVQPQSSRFQAEEDTAGWQPRPNMGVENNLIMPLLQGSIQPKCETCADEEKEPQIQTKLTVGAPCDPYEQEADRVAAKVMAMSDNAPQVQRFGEAKTPIQMWSLAQSITPVVQRQVDEQVQMRQLVQRAFQGGGTQASGDLESRLSASKGGGSTLEPEVRGFMESRFGADFSGVRVHTGGDAVQMNRELGAQAFTHGSDVFFGEGKSPGNNELTAHELTHVVQQTGGVQTKQTSTPVVQRQVDQPGSGSGSITLPEINIVAIPPASLRSKIGTMGYYRQRNADFVSRADSGETPPDYYLNYGDKYVNRFKTVLRPRLSSTGQAWLDCTLIALQTAIEDKRDVNPWAFAEMERDNDKFRDFAYATHSNAYVDCGVCDLPIIDQIKIVSTPDFKDLLSLGGVGQILDSFAQCNAVWFYPKGPSIYQGDHVQRVHLENGRKKFDNPDFQGDSKLEACLNDEDRLRPHETGSSVILVQQGLQKDGGDLGKDGTKGVYGADTGKAVMAFKRKHHLGFETFPDVGPGTMKKLDELGSKKPLPVIPPVLPGPPTPKPTFPPKINFWFNAFIPNTVSGARKAPGGPFAGKTVFAGPPHPFHRNSCFETDDRGFNSTPGVSSRVRVEAELDTTSRTLTHKPGGDLTFEIDCTTGTLKCSNLPKPTISVNLLPPVISPSGVFVILFSAAANDPCVTGSPDLAIRGVININQITRTFSYTGATSLYPAFEMYASFGGPPRTVFTQPPIVDSPFALLVPGLQPVNPPSIRF